MEACNRLKTIFNKQCILVAKLDTRSYIWDSEACFVFLPSVPLSLCPLCAPPAKDSSSGGLWMAVTFPWELGQVWILFLDLSFLTSFMAQPSTWAPHGVIRLITVRSSPLVILVCQQAQSPLLPAFPLPSETPFCVSECSFSLGLKWLIPKILGRMIPPPWVFMVLGSQGQLSNLC